MVLSRPIFNRFICSVLGLTILFSSGGSLAAASPSYQPPSNKTLLFHATPINVLMAPTTHGGATLHALVVMKNSGAMSWYQSGSDAVRLVLDSTQGDSALWQTTPSTGIPLAETEIAPGETAFFEVTLIAPAGAGLSDVHFALRAGAITMGASTPAETVDILCPTVPAAAGAGNAAAISQLSTPQKVVVGGQFEVRATVENTGTDCWTDDDPTRQYRIGRIPPPPAPPGTQQGAWQGPHRFTLDPALLPVRPGDVVELAYTVTAPAALPAPPVDGFEAQLIQERAPGESTGYGWFGNVASSNIEVTDSPTLDAAFVDWDIPSVVVPGESYTARVTMRNRGSETWVPSPTPGTGIVLGMPEGPTVWVPSRHDLLDTVLPNQTVTFEFQIQAPAGLTSTTPGFGPFKWQMLNVGDDWFGDETDSEDPTVRDMSHRITTLGDQFVIDDPQASVPVEFVMQGFNYLPYYDYRYDDVALGSAQNTAWRQYDEAVTEREFRDMARLGANTVRFWASDEYLESGTPAMDQATTCTRLNHALDTAYRNGMRTVLSLPVNRQLIDDAHCPDPNCARNAIGRTMTLFYDGTFRDTIITKNLELLDDCDVLESSKARLFAVEFWQEPHTGNATSRHRLAPSREWHQYVVDTYCDDDEDPNAPSGACCMPGDVGCDPEDVAAALEDAFDAWNYHAPNLNCGNPGSPPNDDVYLCAPDDTELCTGDRLSPWNEMTGVYRAFADAAAHDAYADAISRLEDKMGPLQLDIPVDRQPMVTLGFASFFARTKPQHEASCQDIGYFYDPRFGIDLFDYASFHLYPWSDLSVPFDDAVSDPDLAMKEPENRFHQMRFLLDYVRADRPVVMEEVGYNTCNTSLVEAIQADGSPAVETGGCGDRDATQLDIWTREAESLAAVQANGALFWIYRDRADRAQWGAKRLDDTNKPVYDHIPQLFETIRNGRLLPLLSSGPVKVAPFVQPNWNQSLMESLDDYILESLSNGPPGPVEIEILSPNGPPTP